MHTHSETGQYLIPGRVLLVGSASSFAGDLLDRIDVAAQDSCHAETGREALDQLAEFPPDVVLLHEQLSDMSGLEWLQALATHQQTCDVVMVVAEDGLQRGAVALSQGAVDFLIEPAGHDQVLATLALVAKSRDLKSENERLRRMLQGLRSGDAFVGCSPAARRLVGVLARVAEGSTTVLIEGRQGSGKTLAARIIHTSGRRSEKTCQLEYCETLTEECLGRELQSGHGGTLLLEDIDKLSAESQSRLVKHIKDCSTRTNEERIRIIATTSAHLPELVARGRFREDLYYRLNVFPITVPSLLERRDDIAVLASHFLALAASQSKIPASGFSTTAMILLETHPWPGNVAQLQDAIFRAHALAKGQIVDRQHLLGPTTGLTVDPIQAAAVPMMPDQDSGEENVREEDILALEIEEKRLLARALKATKGNVRRAAQLLRIGRATLYRKIQVYKLKLN